MKVHAIQTGTVAVKVRQQHGEGSGPIRFLNTLRDRRGTDPLPIWVWVIEHPEGLIVVDTGETARATESGYFPRWHPYFRLALREWVRSGDEMGAQMRDRGLDPNEVRWVVMTHLHTDHAGGLEHFPQSEIVVSRTEFSVASGALGKARGYLPHRWPPWFSPRLLDFSSEAYGPFPESARLTDSGDVRIVATQGHSPGHMSLVVEEEENYLLFFAGDTSYTERLMIDGAIDGVAPDAKSAKQTVQRIGDLARSTPVVYMPSHDPDSGSRLSERKTVMPGPS